MTAQGTTRDITKRALDIFGATVGLIVLSPVFAVLWLLIRLKLGGPVIFAQQGPGKDGEILTLLKFRSMLVENHAKGAITDKHRMTPYGRTLRATSPHRLPTLVNVLKGEMSLVGPRPLNVEYLDLYTTRQARRHEVRPGITGLAQVNGRNSLTWEERFDLDVHYVDNHTFWLDLKILWQTVAQVFNTADIESGLITTMPIFVGAPPRDGLVEEPMSDRWRDLRTAWSRSDATQKIGDYQHLGLPNTGCWVYCDEHQTPVGITGLAGLGSTQLHASIILAPGWNTSDAVEALLNRLIYHGRSYDAHRIYLRLPASTRDLYDIAEQLGFVPLDLPQLKPQSHHDALYVAFAAQTGT